jgi:hypothetical protein
MCHQEQFLFSENFSWFSFSAFARISELLYLTKENRGDSLQAEPMSYSKFIEDDNYDAYTAAHERT